MGRFRTPESQASHVLKERMAIGQPRHGAVKNNGKIHGWGTFRTYKEALSHAALVIAEDQLDPTGKGLSGLTPQLAMQYLEMRSQQVGQNQLDKDRRAFQIVLGNVLPRIDSELDHALSSRAYTHRQIELVTEAQTPAFALATNLIADAGLRAHELLTLRRLVEREPSQGRAWKDSRFLGRSNVNRYTVKGKGGLIREVAIGSRLAGRLEANRLAQPERIVDREIFYENYYRVPGGKRWTDSFSKASKRILEWSNGGHGCRHTYAQKRMAQLQSLGMTFNEALAIVSQELGHFRPDITLVYLR